MIIFDHGMPKNGLFFDRRYMMPTMLRFHEAGERRRRGRGASTARQGSGEGRQETRDGRQETRDGEAGTIRDAASPGIFLNMRPGYS